MSFGTIEIFFAFVFFVMFAGVVAIGFLVFRTFKGFKTDFRDCPFCAERIRLKAVVCPHCRRDI
jgi:hypothetical protein